MALQGPCTNLTRPLPRTGNLCSAELQAEVADAIKLLQQLRSQPDLCWRLKQPRQGGPCRRSCRVQSYSQPVSESEAEKREAPEAREAVSEGEDDINLRVQNLEDFKKDVRSWKTSRSKESKDGVDAKEITLGSPAPSFLIRQMILDQLQRAQSMDPESLVAPSPATEPCYERSMDIDTRVNEDPEVRGIDVEFEAVPTAQTCGPSEMPAKSGGGASRGAMADVQKDAFFNAKINEMCESFLEQNAGPDFGVRMAKQSVQLRTQDSKLDALHGEALHFLQSRLGAE